MSELKKHNSIIFLTTLSVYLGLVLVGGASSPILAQAALTRNFDIQEEIEYKDDLDKKPEDEKLDFSKTLDDYYYSVAKFVIDLQRLHQIEKFDLGYDKFEIIESAGVFCKIDGDRARHGETAQRIDNYWLEPAITDAKHEFDRWNFLSDCLKEDESETVFSTRSDFRFSYDKSELKIELPAFKSDNQRAGQLAEKFNRAFKDFQSDDENKIVGQTHKYTTIKSENNQVFLITNLPRASIDSPFAEKDANQAASEK